MTDPLKDLEKELMGMKPTEVPDSVRENIAKALAAEEVRPTVIQFVRARWIGLAALGAAAMLIVSMVYRIDDMDPGSDGGADLPVIAAKTAPRSADVPSVQPVAFGRTYSGDYQISPVVVTGGVPVRFVRYGTVEHVLGSNSAQGVQYRISVPKQETVPVSVQAY
jgi:hypothetical protein